MWLRCETCFFALCLIALVGCSVDNFSQDELCGNGADDDGNGLTDCADPQCSGHQSCAKPPPPVDADAYIAPDLTPPAPTTPPRLQLVVSELSAPKSDKDHAIDLDGNGTKDNKLGAIMGLLAAAAAGIDLQAEIDSTIDKGYLLLLAELFGTSLVNDKATIFSVHQGTDTDGDANNNFTGSATLKIHKDSPKEIRLGGSISKGKLDVGPGTLAIPLPLVPNQPPISVTLKRARVQGTISAAGIKGGLLTGAIPQTDVDKVLIPALAKMITHFLTDPSTPASTINLLKIFDANKDNVVSADEIKGSIVAIALKPDVVISGEPDRVPDALSIGFGFTAVPCTITK